MKPLIQHPRIREEMLLKHLSGRHWPCGAMVLLDTHIWSNPDATNPSSYRTGSKWSSSSDVSTLIGSGSRLAVGIPRPIYAGDTFWFYACGGLPTVDIRLADSSNYPEILLANHSWYGVANDEAVGLVVPDGFKPPIRVASDPYLVQEGENFSLLNPVGYSFLYRYCNDIVTEDYLDQIRAGRLITNSCVRIRAEFPLNNFVPFFRPVLRLATGTNYTYPVCVGYLYYQIFLPKNTFAGRISPACVGLSEDPVEPDYFIPDPRDSCFGTGVEALLEKAETEALNAATEGQMDMLTEIAEAPQTYRFTVKLCRRMLALRKAYSCVLRGDVAGVKKILKKLGLRRLASNTSNAWLEYRYGWRQMAFSIDDWFSSLKTVATKKVRSTFSRRYCIPGRSNSLSDKLEQVLLQKEWDLPFGTQQVSWGNYSTSRYQYFGKVMCVAGVGADLKSSDKFLKRLKHAWGGLNTLKTTWEVIPYSFIVDWWVNTAELVGAASVNREVLTRRWISLGYPAVHRNARLIVTVGYPDLNDIFADIYKDWYPALPSAGPSESLGDLAEELNNDDEAVSAVVNYTADVYIRGVFKNPQDVGPRFIHLKPEWAQTARVLDLVTIVATKMKIY